MSISLCYGPRDTEMVDFPDIPIDGEIRFKRFPFLSGGLSHPVDLSSFGYDRYRKISEYCAVFIKDSPEIVDSGSGGCQPVDIVEVE